MRLLDFVSVLLAALVAGTTFGILFGYNPAGISGPAYVEVQQEAIRGLNVLIPALGGLAILCTVFDAWLSRASRGRAGLLIIAACFFVAAAVITRFGNQPINSIVAAWNAKQPPSEWQSLRDQWWQWHVIRTWITVVGLAILIVATQMKSRSDLGSPSEMKPPNHL